MDAGVIVTLLGVMAGGLIGFFSAWYLDVRRRQYELKRQIYLEVLETLTEAIKFWFDNENKLIELNKFNNIAYKFQLTIYKLVLCGCSKEVYEIIDKNLTHPDTFKDAKRAHNIIFEELIPALRKDLNVQWQFLWRE
jgi:hypothetical protein